MAILKHIASHNANYADVIDYLTKEHDEETGEVILDENEQMIDREGFLIAGINCTPENFSELCWKDCFRFNVNRSETEVKTHQYILSFDPKDKAKGLTVEAAQKEGLKFAKKNFPGHRCIVCTHPDGANGSGNIHVHIVISSVRFEEREPNAEFMKLQKDGNVKDSEFKAGCKHQDTARLRRYLNEQLQEFCRENGYTVAGQKPPKKTTNKEYKAKAEGQKRLDKDNEARRRKGQEPAQTEFKSKKDDLRKVISHAVSVSKDWNEFAQRLRAGYTRQVEQRPQQPRIPYQERQEMWSRYKSFNEEFWTRHRKLADVYKEDLSADFKRLRERSSLEWQKKNRKNSMSERRAASQALLRTADRESIKGSIEIAKEKQKKLQLFKDVYQAYSKAAKMALSHDMKDEAKHCLECMEELRRRQEGYWVDDWIGNSPERRIMPGGVGQKSRVTWLMTEESELEAALDMMDKVEMRVRELAKSNEQPAIVHEVFPIDVKVSRGVISFKHPDLERWTRGKSLGADFEMEELARVMEQNRLQVLDLPHERVPVEVPKKSEPER